MADTDGAAFGTAPSADYIDPRDWPQPSPGPGGFDPPSTTPVVHHEVPVRVSAPVPVIPGFGRILAAGPITIPANGGPVLVGLDPSRPQGQLNVAYLMISTGDALIDVAGTPSALPGQRAPLVILAGHIILPHIAGLYAWDNAGNPQTFSWLVVGV